MNLYGQTWWKRWDSNSRDVFTSAAFQEQCNKPDSATLPLYSYPRHKSRDFITDSLSSALTPCTKFYGRILGAASWDRTRFSCSSDTREDHLHQSGIKLVSVRGFEPLPPDPKSGTLPDYAIRSLIFGIAWEIRTPGPLLRRQVLYPSELRRY